MPFLNDQDAAFVRKRFEQELSHDVTLEFFAPSTGGLTLPGQDAGVAEHTTQILTAVAGPPQPGRGTQQSRGSPKGTPPTRASAPPPGPPGPRPARMAALLAIASPRVR